MKIFIIVIHIKLKNNFNFNFNYIEGILCITFYSCGSYLATGSKDCTVNLINLRSNDTIKKDYNISKGNNIFSNKIKNN